LGHTDIPQRDSEAFSQVRGNECHKRGSIRRGSVDREAPKLKRGLSTDSVHEVEHNGVKQAASGGDLDQRGSANVDSPGQHSH